MRVRLALTARAELWGVHNPRKPGASAVHLPCGACRPHGPAPPPCAGSSAPPASSPARRWPASRRHSPGSARCRPRTAPGSRWSHRRASAPSSPGAGGRTPHAPSPPRCSAPRRASWPAWSRCSRPSSWCGPRSRSSRSTPPSSPPPGTRHSCVRRCWSSPARWPSPPPRSTPRQPRCGAPGMPGWSRCWPTPSCAATSATTTSREPPHWAGRARPHVFAMAGTTPDATAATVVDALRRAARHNGLDAVSGVHGHELICVLGGTLGEALDPLPAASALVAQFGPGQVVVGPVVDDLTRAVRSVAAARAGLRAAAGWPDAPRPVLRRRPAPRAGARR